MNKLQKCRYFEYSMNFRYAYQMTEVLPNFPNINSCHINYRNNINYTNMSVNAYNSYFIITTHTKYIMNTVYYGKLNHLTPNCHFSGRTAPLTYRCCILYLFNRYTY